MTFLKLSGSEKSNFVNYYLRWQIFPDVKEKMFRILITFK